MMLDFPQVPGLAVWPLRPSANGSKWRTEAMRSHQNDRLLLITKGQGRITVAGLTNGFGPNNLIYIPAQTIYGMEMGTGVTGFTMALPKGVSGFNSGPFHLRLTDVGKQKELINYFEAVETELAPDGDERAAGCRLGLLLVFVERQLAKFQGDATDKRRQSAAARLVASYTKLIANDFASDKSVSEYAAQLGVTPTHLTRSCRKTCGQSALMLLNDRKHFEACMLLSETERPIRDIAAGLGFHSPAYFTRSFQERAGKTPSQFRKHA